MEDYQVQMLTAFFAFLAGWGLSLLNDRRHKLQHVKDACNSLIHELREEKQKIDNLKKSFSISDEGKVQIEHTSIGISRYESLIYSGLFRELDYDVQNMTGVVYGKIKHANHMSYRLLELLMNKGSVADSIFIENMNEFGENLDGQFVDIKNKIPKLIKLIEERIPTAIL